MKVAIIGAGLQARRRAPVIRDWPDAEIKIITAARQENAETLASQMECEAGVGWEGIVDRPDLDAVVVLTPPHIHAPISITAMKAGKHVFCEKPLARTLEEAEEMTRAAKDNGVVLKCGFNHRHHPAIVKAKAAFDDGIMGEPMFVRCRYGICGRPGYDQEWRTDPNVVSGGHLMEQGIHALDLFRWFLGDIKEVTGFVQSAYWPTEPLEDNSFAIVRTETGCVASLHSSLTQWKNLFSFEAFGRDGYAVVDGLGGGYGTERLVIGKRDFDAPFQDQVTHFRGGDRSWHEEWKEFVAAVEEQRRPIGDGEDGLEALRIVFAVYEAARTGKTVSLK